MRKAILFVLIIALAATQCEALNRHRKSLRVMVEVSQELTQSDNYSLQELLDFNVAESISCSEV